MSDVMVGCYALPVDVSDEPDNVHALEGTVWAIERRLDETTGELTDHLHVVRVWQGDLKFTMWPAARAGTITPPTGPTIDGIIKMAGKQLLAHGRRSEQRVFGLVHALAPVAMHIPKVDAPSVFEHGMTLPPDEEDGWVLRSKPDATPGVMQASMVGRLIDRYTTVADVDHTAANEIRREARDKGLPYLEAGSELSLADLATYDVLLTRWERQIERRQAS